MSDDHQEHTMTDHPTDHPTSQRDAKPSLHYTTESAIQRPNAAGLKAVERGALANLMNAAAGYLVARMGPSAAAEYLRDGLVAGERVYGVFDPATDTRDFEEEIAQEARDLLNYGQMEQAQIHERQKRARAERDARGRAASPTEPSK